VLTTILDQEYILTAIQVGLIVVAGWKTSFFVGSCFANIKPVVVVKPEEEKAKMSESEAEPEKEQEQVTDEHEDVPMPELEAGITGSQRDDEVRSNDSDVASLHAPGWIPTTAWMQAQNLNAHVTQAGWQRVPP